MSEDRVGAPGSWNLRESEPDHWSGTGASRLQGQKQLHLHYTVCDIHKDADQEMCAVLGSDCVLGSTKKEPSSPPGSG